jgi:4-amino-4-deoxy-L-arabinose transferase-like glycosyltransferase
MTAWVAKLGLLLCGGWVHPVSLRLGFTLLFGASTWVMYRWGGGWAGFYAALFLNLSAYYAVAGGFALPDGPFLFFALLTMWAASEAVLAGSSEIRPWLWVGLAFGGALLSKYHGVFLPAAVVLYALITPGARRLLWSPGPYLAVAIGFALFSPVLIWNAQHDWASFVFQGGRAVGKGFRPEGLLAVGLGPIAFLTPWVWGLLMWQLAIRLRHFRSVDGIDRLAVCMAVVPMAFFTLVGCSRWILLHWPLIGFVSLMPVLGAAWARWAAEDAVWSRKRLGLMAVLLISAAGVGLMQARFGVFRFPGKDPLADISGWESVAKELEKRGLTREPRTFICTNRWFDSGQLAFNLREHPPVLCYSAGDARGFAFWSEPEQWLGWNGLYVTASDGHATEARTLEIFFKRVEFVAEFPMTRGGNPFRTVRVYRCIEQTTPFPYKYETRPS